MRNTDEPRAGIEVLAAGAAIFHGRTFDDERGRSWETLNTTDLSRDNPTRMTVAQENFIQTQKAGTLRGLHYQVGTFAQAKLVSVARGAAQFFWLDLQTEIVPAPVHSVILESGPASLWTPEWCAHGFLALADNTIVVLKMSRPINLEQRGELSFFADDIRVDFERMPRLDLLSERDASAPSFSNRRPIETFQST